MIFDKIYNLVKSIPPSKVLTYKSIAKMLRIRDIRLIGYALHRNEFPQRIPCHRVVRSDGSLASGYAFGGRQRQIKLLEKENVYFKKNGVDLTKSFWKTSSNEKK